jgi:hypothetical protein
MNSALLQIIDNAFQFAIWCFLISFVVLLIFARTRLRARRKRIEELYGLETSEDPSGISESSPWFNPWKISIKTSLVAFIVAVFGFFIYLFLPFPGFDNFSAGSEWRVVPVRVTAISYDRSYEGFSLEGEIWNQTEDQPLELFAVIKVVGTDDKPLDELEVPIDPSPIEPGKSGSFEVQYEENSPFIKGYRIAFFSTDGTQVPHLTGFDVN